jgi:hypothetical protein
MEEMDGKTTRLRKTTMTIKQKIATEILAVAKELLSVDFSTKEEFDKYMKDHPDANRSNHKVVEIKKEPTKKEEPKSKIRADRVLLRRELSKKVKENDLIPQEKDDGRISDIAAKATSGGGKNKSMDIRKVESLTNSMASKIGDPAKAFRRAQAFYDYLIMKKPRLHPDLYSRLQKMPQIFLDRCAELLNGKKANQQVASELLMVAKDLMSKEAWKDWGWLNGHRDAESKRFVEQRKKHDTEKRLHPADHKVLENVSTMRGYDHFKCSCGFEYQSDSSD